jgi:putative DNA primase/helicase
MFFKGYIQTKGKRAVEKFKNGEKLRTFDEVKDLYEYAGILASDTVLIDVDNEEESKLLLDIIERENIVCQVRKTTRGRHFFFLNNGKFNQCHTHIKLACGITADVKIGKTNSYSILKLNGMERSIEYDRIDNEGYDPVPFWCNVVKSNIDLINLEDGDGRNSALFNYILTLQSIGLNKEQIKKTINIINDYVFSTKLSQSEIESITRDEAFKQDITPEFYDGKTFLFNVLAQHLVDTLPIKRINGLLHVYNDGFYQDGADRIQRKMIEIIPTLSMTKRNEVLKYIELLCVEDHPQAPAKYIGFKNGIYDVDTDQLIPFNQDILLTNKIEFNYNADAKYPLMDNTLTKLSCDDQSIRKTIEEMIGYTLFRKNELRKFFVLLGDKRNGKSTLLHVITKMLGENNISSLDLNDLCGDKSKFRLAEVYRKLANIGDDISDEFISDNAIFKKLVSGDKVTAERKGEDPFNFANYSKFIFSANNLPRSKDKTGALLDRMIIIPFNAIFDKNSKDYDPFIKDKLLEDQSIEYLIKIGIEALKGVLERKEFTIGEKIKTELKHYDELNNPILSFYEEFEIDRLTMESIDYIYNAYKEFCYINNYNPISRIEFARQTTKNFNFDIYRKTIAGKTKKYFKKIALSDLHN